MLSFIYKSRASQFAITDPGPSQRTSPAEDSRPVPGSTSLYPPLAWEDLSYPSHSANFLVSLQRLTSDIHPENLAVLTPFCMQTLAEKNESPGKEALV